MKITVINPPILFYGLDQTIFHNAGVIYLLGALADKKVGDIQFIDAPIPKTIEFVREVSLGLRIEHLFRRGISDDEIIERCKGSDVVMMSIPFTISSQYHLELMKEIKEVTGAHTVVGGMHPTALPEECLKYVDTVVTGEAEGAIPECLHKNGIIKGPVVDVNTVRAGWEFVDFDGYKETVAYSIAANGRRWAPLITSRGCPRSCVFCSINITMGRQWRARTVEHVIAEIEKLVNMGVTLFLIDDDNFTANMDRAKKILRVIIDKGWKIELHCPNGIRLDRIDRELLTLMKQAGFIRISISPESGSQRVLDECIKKGFKLTDIMNAINLIQELGFEMDCFLVIGTIGETQLEMFQTFKFAHMLRERKIRSTISIATPYPMTQLWKEAKAKGYMADNVPCELFFHNCALLSTPEFTAGAINVLKFIGDCVLFGRFGVIYKGVKYSVMTLVDDVLSGKVAWDIR